jgi:hypothetical protein
MPKLALSKSRNIATKGICVQGVFEDSVFLNAHCSCGHENHQQTLEIFTDDLDTHDINLTIYSKIFTPYMSYNPTCWQDKVEYFYKDVKRRIEWIISIVFKGYVEAENIFTLHGQEQIDDYIDAISRAKNQIWLNVQAKKK